LKNSTFSCKRKSIWLTLELFVSRKKEKPCRRLGGKSWAGAKEGGENESYRCFARQEIGFARKR